MVAVGDSVDLPRSKVGKRRERALVAAGDSDQLPVASSLLGDAPLADTIDTRGPLFADLAALDPLGALLGGAVNALDALLADILAPLNTLLARLRPAAPALIGTSPEPSGRFVAR